MGFVKQNDPLWQVLESIAADENLQLYDLEKLGPDSLRLSVERRESEGNGLAVDLSGSDEALRVTSSDCSRFCKRLSIFLAAEGASYGVSTEPRIEVSSPGINRELRLPEHFKGAVGERVKIVTLRDLPLNGKQKSVVTGCLENFEDNSLAVRDEQTDEQVELLLGDVKRARVDFRFGDSNGQ